MKFFLIKLAYWLGIVADSLWAVLLFFPQIFGRLTGSPDFSPELQTRLIMAIGGILMTGWTLILLWAVKKPIERRVIILITACPVVLGLFMVALIGYLKANSSNEWILVKTFVLFVTMVTSYLLATKMSKETIPAPKT